MSLIMSNNEVLQGGQLLPLVEDFYTIQGEGFHTGKPAYFIRLGGCDVGCKWCDAKYTWNPKLYPPTDIEVVVRRTVECQAKSIVITGGEPLLYPLEPLTSRLKAENLKIFLETSGSHPFSGYFDWVCLSPKRKQPPLEEAFGRADELKVVIESPKVRSVPRNGGGYRRGKPAACNGEHMKYVNGAFTLVNAKQSKEPVFPS